MGFCSSTVVFTAWRYASAVYAMTLCPSVCLSVSVCVCHKSPPPAGAGAAQAQTESPKLKLFSSGWYILYTCSSDFIKFNTNPHVATHMRMKKNITPANL